MRALQQTGGRTHERALLQMLYAQAEIRRGKPPYQDFHQLTRKLLQDGLYGRWIDSYTTSEIKWLGLQLDAKRDELWSSVQLNQYRNEFLTSDYHGQQIGLPQERLMLIAMAAMQNEHAHRLEKVQEVYWALSHCYINLPDEVLSFFGKTFRGWHAEKIPYSINLADHGVPTFLSSKVKEKHIHVPGHFMKQVQACGYWHVSDKHRRAKEPGHLEATTRVSAVGWMKQLLSSNGIILHFTDENAIETSPSDVSIHLSRIVQKTDLARVCRIIVYLLAGLEEVGKYSCRVKVAGWEETMSRQGISRYSVAAVEFIEDASNELNVQLRTAAARYDMQKPLRKASDIVYHFDYPATEHRQSGMIDCLLAEQRYTDQGGSITLEKSPGLETAELLQLLMKAWSGGIPEVRLV